MSIRHSVRSNHAAVSMSIRPDLEFVVIMMLSGSVLKSWH